MLWAGLILIAIAVGLLFVARSLNRRDRHMAVAETLTAAEIADLQKAAADAVGPGSFSKVCEVVGAAEPGDGGALTAPESNQPAVWHRTKVTEHYYDWERDSDGDRRRVQRERELTSSSSEADFRIKDATGAVFVTVKGADIDEPPKTFDRFEKDKGVDLGSGALASVAEAFANWNDDTIGIQREEWSLRPGQRLYVIGEVSDTSGRVAFGKPEKGKYIVSTRTEAELRKSAQTWAKVWAVACAFLFAAGLALTIAGAIVLAN
jgi:E3 Ubiquitin ligase